MTTSTPADLPALTSLETDAAIAVAWAEPGASMLQTAARLKLAPAELIEILERPHVAAFTQAAREIEAIREERIARHDRAAARADLLAVAKDPEATVDARLRAAIAILHDLRATPASSSPATSRPSLRPSSAQAHAPRLPAPVLTASSVPGGSQPDNREHSQPTPAAADKPPPPSTPALPAASNPITLHRAAGAPIARREHGALDHPASCGTPSPAARPP